MEKLERERDNLRTMRDNGTHVNIAKFYYDTKDENHFYFVFELYWGDLSKL